MGAHSGSYDSHDDDCRCVFGGRMYCNRNGNCWSCCGACKQDSQCTGSSQHPTACMHPIFFDTIASYQDGRPVYKSNEEIERIYEDWLRSGRT
jgi:hypothetical protein